MFYQRQTLASDKLCRSLSPVATWTPIAQPYKSHIAPAPYPTKLHSENKCAHGTLWDIGQVHLGIRDTGLVVRTFFWLAGKAQQSSMYVWAIICW